ncbi:MAG: helix-turn-helix domain-containing protein [Bacteroidales bacterium]|nr:helix-turn-helix domain-containing protein [Bacteroidales bacterium]
MPAAKFEIERRCKVCGATFLAKNIDSTVCSRKCTNAAYRMRKRDQAERARLMAIAKEIPITLDILTIAQAEAIFEVSAKALHRMIHRGEINAINPGQRMTRVSRTELARILPLRKEEVESTPLRARPKLYNMEPEACYTVGEISKQWRMSESSVFAAIRKYSIPIRQIGKYVYAPKEDIDHLFKTGSIL